MISNGTSGAAPAIDWTLDADQDITITADAVFSFIPPERTNKRVRLKLCQDATGARTVTWPNSVKWLKGPPTLCAGEFVCIEFLYDGATYHEAVPKEVTKFTREHDVGDVHGRFAVDYRNGMYQRATLVGDTSITFEPDPPVDAQVTVVLAQDDRGRHAVTWDPTCKWFAAVSSRADPCPGFRTIYTGYKGVDGMYMNSAYLDPTDDAARTARAYARGHQDALDEVLGRWMWSPWGDRGALQDVLLDLQLHKPVVNHHGTMYLNGVPVTQETLENVNDVPVGVKLSLIDAGYAEYGDEEGWVTLTDKGERLDAALRDGVPAFHAKQWVTVKGRGLVALVGCDKERDREKTGIVGPVLIDGEPYECTGVERRLPAFPIAPGEEIGLLVREQSPEDGPA